MHTAPETTTTTTIAGREAGLIGTRVRELRLRAKLTQEKLAAKAGLSRIALVRLESGARLSASLQTLQRLAAVLGVGVAELTESVAESRIEPTIKAYRDSPWADIDKPTELEIDWLLSRYWIFSEITPSPEHIHEILKLRRDSPR
jgi:transcriptional regulator with XRE-family HTH domain